MALPMTTSASVTPGTLRVGIAGCGAISRNHLEAFRALDNVQIVGVCDIDPDRARATAAAWGIPAAVTTVGELLGLGLDLVSVCTPHPTHEDVVLQAAAAGVHVLCEKPIAIELASAERMVTACDDAGVKLGVLFQRRFWPAAQRIRAAIDDGTLGRPIMGQCKINTYKHGDHIEVEDSAAAVITFTSGAKATLEASTAASPSLGVQIRVTGETGASASLTEFPEGSDGRVDLWAVSETISSEPAHPDGILANVDLATINGQLIPHHTTQVRDFVQALRDGKEPAITGGDATKALRILLAVYESSRTGLPVRFAEVLSGVRPMAPVAG